MHEPLKNIRNRLAEVINSWESAPSVEYIRNSFADYLNEVGPQGARLSDPQWEEVAPGLRGAWIGQGERYALYCHGGGFQVGGITSHASLIARLADAGQLKMFAAQYRLAPEHRYPAASDDVFDIYKAMVEQHGVPLAVVADSAGGGLALQALQRARDKGVPLPCGLVLISPWLDLSMQSATYASLAGRDIFSTPERLRLMARTYVGRTGPALDSPSVSPVWGKLSGLPPIVVHAGAADITLGDSELLVQRVRDAGGHAELRVFADMCHHFQVFEALPEARASITELGKRLQSLYDDKR